MENVRTTLIGAQDVVRGTGIKNQDLFGFCKICDPKQDFRGKICDDEMIVVSN